MKQNDKISVKTQVGARSPLWHDNKFTNINVFSPNKVEMEMQIMGWGNNKKLPEPLFCIEVDEHLRVELTKVELSEMIKQKLSEKKDKIVVEFYDEENSSYAQIQIYMDKIGEVKKILDEYRDNNGGSYNIDEFLMDKLLPCKDELGLTIYTKPNKRIYF